MKISEITIYKLEATEDELDLGIYDRRDTSPYYRINNNWYVTNDNKIFPLNVNTNGLYMGMSKILEDIFKEMMPFKGQLELF